jgi:hypothetical protein
MRPVGSEEQMRWSVMERVPWGDGGGGIRAFCAEVGGIVFEVVRVELGP